jgi:antitoxin component of RelBE/YafQ-DinJ toxin-antitoxin module
MIIRIDETLKDNVARLAKTEGRTISEVIRALLEKYLADKDFPSTVNKVWNEARNKMEAKGYSEKDIERAIKEVRSQR